MLGWSQDTLAARSNIATSAIADFETGTRETHTQTLDDLRVALEAGGIIFIEENGEGEGVRMRASRKHAHDHPEPVGPATEIIKAMDAAIDRHRNPMQKRK